MLEQRFRHCIVVNKAHRISFSALLQTRSHFLNEALVDRRLYLNFGIARELKAIRISGLNIKDTPKYTRQTGADNVVEQNINFALGISPPRDSDKTAKHVGRNLHNRVLDALVGLHIDREIQRFVGKRGDRQLITEQYRLECRKYFRREITLDECELSFGQVFFVDDVNVTSSQLSHHTGLNPVKLALQLTDSLLNGLEQVFCALAFTAC